MTQIVEPQTREPRAADAQTLDAPALDAPALDAPATAPGAPAADHPAGPGYPGYPPSRSGRFADFLLRLWARIPRWGAPAAILACFAGAAAFVTVREPTDGAFDQTTCLLKYTTGLDCPGCGGTRAFFYLIQGNVPAAARHHAVFVFAVPFLVYMFAAWAGNRVFGWRIPMLRPGPLAVGMVLVAAGVFAVLRNLPFAPFTWFYV